MRAKKHIRRLPLYASGIALVVGFELTASAKGWGAGSTLAVGLVALVLYCLLVLALWMALEPNPPDPRDHTSMPPQADENRTAAVTTSSFGWGPSSPVNFPSPTVVHSAPHKL